MNPPRLPAALLHTQLDKIMPLVRHLWSISQQVSGGGGGIIREAELLAPLLRQRHISKFDSSSSLTLEKPCPRRDARDPHHPPSNTGLFVRNEQACVLSASTAEQRRRPVIDSGCVKLQTIPAQVLLRQCGLEFFRQW